MMNNSYKLLKTFGRDVERIEVYKSCPEAQAVVHFALMRKQIGRRRDTLQTLLTPADSKVSFPYLSIPEPTGRPSKNQQI